MMIIVGAITRLTESGLSMVEWRPLIGALPPLSDTEWLRVFELYKATPEFQKTNFWMEMSDFKQIFFWEWFHRLLGRLIGMAYALPLIWFWIKNRIPQGFKPKLIGLLILGGLQGYMGWFMVKSGLVDQPNVSHYRLAAHLGLALLIFALLVKTALTLWSKPPAKHQLSKPLILHLWMVLVCLIMTIFWGAYTAGLDAGLIYNDTFPKMGESWLPYDMALYQPFFVNLFENHAAVQWMHRWLAIMTTLAVLSFWGHAVYRRQVTWPIHALAAMVLIQVILGIATLFSHVMIAMAVTHQAGAVMVLGLWVVNLHHGRHTSV